MSTPESPEVAAYIAAQASLRARAGAAMAARWASLPAYNREDVPAFLRLAVPLTLATQRASVAITTAFLARRLGVPQFGINPADVVIRNGVPPEEVYSRPFVNVWSDLKDGKAYEDAVASGLHRATSAVQMDAQLANFATLPVAARQEPRILGYRRVPDPGACAFCLLIAGRRYTTEHLQPVHNHCGCGVDVITAENRGDFTGKPENDLDLPAGVAVAEHGELGPLLVDPAETFTDHAAIAA